MKRTNETATRRTPSIRSLKKLRSEAAEWVDTFEHASHRPTVTFGEIYAWGGRAPVRDQWVSEPLDMPRHIAIEMMRWLEARAARELTQVAQGAHNDP